MKRLTFAAAVVVGFAASFMAGPAAQSSSSWLAPAGPDFPLAGGNLGNQRYSSLTGVDRTNIARLGGAWRINISEGQPSDETSTTPVVVDGVMYLGAGGGDVLAVNAATGAVLWRYKSSFGSQDNRGVAVAEGKVFSGQAGSRIVALDQKTGSLLWETKVYEGTGRGGGTPGATIYSDGRVFVGISGGEAGVRGQVGAYDAATGRELWKFHTIPGPGERGHETWEGDSWMRGGGPMWTQPATDPDLGLVYFPIGNAWPDQNGAIRGGDNLYTASILALDVRTGAYRWHFQTTRHDLWDYDNPLPPVLADIRIQGELRKVLFHGGKSGLTYVLDRTNGEPIVGVEERPVPQVRSNKTARTQPFPLGDSPVPYCPEPGSVVADARSSCVFGPFRPDDPVVMTPGTQGGLNWAPVTFSHGTGLFYVPASMINSRFDSGFGRPPGQPRAGMLSAIDPATNRIVWQVRTKYPLGTGSGLLSTAAGLMFNGQSDGNLVAYDIRTGDELWRFQTGAGADAPVVTYEVDGQQYVAVLAAGNNFQLAPRGDFLWAFKIDGKIPPAASPEPPPTIQPAGGRGRGRGGAAQPPGGAPGPGAGGGRAGAPAGRGN